MVDLLGSVFQVWAIWVQMLLTIDGWIQELVIYRVIILTTEGENSMKLGSGVNPGFAATELNCMLIKEIGVRLNSHEGLDYISAHLGSQELLI